MTDSNKRSIHVFVCIFIMAAGILAGHYFNGSTVFDLKYYVTSSKDLTSHVADTVIPLCMSQMIQFSAVFISAFSIFAYPVSYAVILYRSFIIGSCISSVIQNGTVSYQAFAYFACYTLITVVIAVFSIRLNSTVKDPQLPPTLKGALLVGFRCTLLFLMTSGAAFLIRLAPLIIFR